MKIYIFLKIVLENLGPGLSLWNMKYEYEIRSWEKHNLTQLSWTEALMKPHVRCLKWLCPCLWMHFYIAILCGVKGKWNHIKCVFLQYGNSGGPLVNLVRVSSVLILAYSCFMFWVSQVALVNMYPRSHLWFLLTHAGFQTFSLLSISFFFPLSNRWCFAFIWINHLQWFIFSYWSQEGENTTYSQPCPRAMFRSSFPQQSAMKQHSHLMTRNWEMVKSPM